MREITLAGNEAPLRVYDTSGPQGGDVREGLPALRQPWIDGARSGGLRATGADGRGLRGAPDAADARAQDEDGASRHRPGHAAALRAQGRDHAGDGVHRHPRRVRRRVRARRSRARPRDHPGQHQSPRARADDHRPALRGEDQRQHRQLGGELVDRGRSRQAALVDAVGRRHGDGPLDRARHPRDPRVDHPQLRGADRHGARSIRRSRRSAAGPKT